MADGLPRIEVIWAWVCTDKDDGTEGVPAMQMVAHDGTIFAVPMYSARRENVLKMRGAAEELAAQGHHMALCEFAARITHDVIKP